jgi:protein SCO1/2
VVGLPLYRAFTTPLQPPPPQLRQIPSFVLRDEMDRPFGSSQLAGKVWIADFIYTRCSAACPQLTQAMVRVRDRVRNLRGSIHLVSFSVDPTQDTPRRLHEYAVEHHALGTGEWSFLTGPPADLRNLVRDGFRLGFGTAHEHATTSDAAVEATAELFEIAHAQKLVLVDQDLWIRGFYGTDRSEIDRLMHDVHLVVNLGGPRAASLR